MAVSIACPQCRAVMRSANPIPAGRKVKCPKCAAEFPAPSNGVAAGKPSAQGTNKVVPSKPSAQGNKVVPNKASAQGNKVVPSKPSATGTEKPVERRKGGKLKLVMALTLLLTLVGGSYWVYSQIAAAIAESSSDSQASASQPTETTPAPAVPVPPRVTDDPLFYLPADSTLIAGLDPVTLLKLPAVQEASDLILKAPDIAAPVSEFRRLTGLGLEDVERLVVATTGGQTVAERWTAPGSDRPQSIVIVARSKGPLDLQRLAQSPEVIETKQGERRTYYTLKSSALTLPFESRAVCTPADRLVVVAIGPTEKVGEIMQQEGSAPTFPAKLLPILRKVEKSQAWAVTPLEGELKQQLAGALAMAPPDMQASAKALEQARAAAVWVVADSQGLKVSAGVLCPSEAVARDLSGGLGVAWTKTKAPLQQQFGPVIKELTSDLRTLAEDFFRSSMVSADGEVVLASVQLSMAPIEGLAKIAKAVGPGVLLASVETARLKAVPAAPPPGGAGANSEKELLALVNKVREAEKLPPLKADPKLTVAALEQAKAAAKLANFNTIDIENVLKHVQDAGYDYVNLNANFELSPEKDKYDGMVVVDKWLAEVGNKNNLFSKEYSECGIGMAPSETNELFVVMIFAAPLKKE